MMISIEEAIEKLIDRPGIVFGNTAILNKNSLSLLVNHCCTELKISNVNDMESFSLQLDTVRRKEPSLAPSIELQFIDELKKLESNPDLHALTKVDWKLGISLTYDMLLESAIKDLYDARPTSRTVTIVDHPSINLYGKTLPIYKLLGNYQDERVGYRLAISASDLMSRKHNWMRILKSCTDHLKGSPLLFLGTETDTSLVRELLSIFQNMGTTHPDSLMFLKGDPILEDPIIANQLSGFLNVSVVDGDIREFCKELSKINTSQYRLRFTDEKASATSLEKYKNILYPVPHNTISDADFQLNKRAIVDLLFQPNAIQWAPFQCNIDFPRKITSEIQSAVVPNINTEVNKSTGKHTFILHGDSGVGKTIVMKRLSSDLSKLGIQVFWLKRYGNLTNYKAIRAISDELNHLHLNNASSNFAIFVDDPWALHIDPNEFVNCFESCKANLFLFFSYRNTDFFNPTNNFGTLPSFLGKKFEIPNRLVAEELHDLFEMLVKIEAFASLDEAKKIHENVLKQSADDILCSLWYLLPSTQNALSESIRDEYHRLGSAQEFVSSVAQSVLEYSAEAKLAYEYVAVASKFQVGLPIEILVRAIGTSYENFIKMSEPDRPLWGLLYNVSDENAETVLFKTRNEVVTRILLKLVNGGVGVAGEFKILRGLIDACANGSEIYRNFIIEILVRKRRDVEKYFSYQQGVELYTAAIKAVGSDDRLLEHHFGIWHKSKGYFEESYLQLQKALLKSHHPSADSDRESPEDHIHTTMAAAVVGLVKENKQVVSTGFDLVMDHLNQAASSNYLDPHAGHVRANILYEMALFNKKENGDREISMASYAIAMHEIEKHLQSLGPIFRKNAKCEKSIFLLNALQQKLIDIHVDEIDLKDQALKIFESNRSQIGIEFYLRKILLHAQKTNKGTDYNHVKTEILEFEDLIETKGEQPSVQISLVYIDLIVRWRLQNLNGSVDWAQLKQRLSKCISDERFRDDPLLSFYMAVTQYHLGYYDNANALFSHLRRLPLGGLKPNDVRCFYMGNEGNAKRFQCAINKSYGTSYVSIPELKQDIRLVKTEDKAANHVFIGFSLNGPIVQFARVDNARILLG